MLLDAYYSEKIISKYIIHIAKKGFIIVDHLFEVYRMSDAYKYIDKNLPFCLVLDINARQKSNLINQDLAHL
jgi:hypothetical protein